MVSKILFKKDLIEIFYFIVIYLKSYFITNPANQKKYNPQAYIAFIYPGSSIFPSLLTEDDYIKI
jgi:hypothetical protein